jgi:hypothetical protein
LRKFYSEDKYERLKSEKLMTEIMALANFWRYLNINVQPDDEVRYIISNQARKHLHCLNCYPNEFWKYVTSVFFLKNMDSGTFDADFCKMLEKLIASLFVKFIDAPTVNAIKDDIYSSCISIQNQNELQFRIALNEELLKQNIDNHSSSRISRALLLLDAYLNVNQIDLIPDTFDIEHIFPKKWQDNNYFGWDRENADLFLDKFGNKIVFEKKLNISAGNGYFGVKKGKYSLSKIAAILDLSNYPKNDWVKSDIEEREAKFKENLITFFQEQLIN